MNESPFRFHEMEGVGNPEAVQVKFTVPPAVPLGRTDTATICGLTNETKSKVEGSTFEILTPYLVP